MAAITKVLDLGSAGQVQVPDDEYWQDQTNDVLRHLSGSQFKRRRRRWVPYLKNLDSITNLPIEVSGVKVGLRLNFRKWTRRGRVDWAAYHWLRPFKAGVIGRDRIDGLIHVAGLDHLERKQVLTEVRSSCQHLAIQYPRLFRWVQFRIAELDMMLEPTVLEGSVWRSLEVGLRRRLVLLSGLLWRDPSQARDEAEKLSQDSLDLVARTVAHLLQPPYERTRSGEPPMLSTRLNASLMVPVRSLDVVKKALIVAYPELTNDTFDKAEELWANYPSEVERYLMLVAETIQPRRHVGFWVPVSEKSTLPGGPYAFLNGRGSLVAKQRLPSLDSEPLNGRWQAYVREKVHGSFFMSFPVLVREDPSNNPSVVGVINVNIGTPGDRVWERALHDGWMRAVANEISAFAEIAHYATLARFAASHFIQETATNSELKLVLDTKEPKWNAFPGVAVTNALDLRRKG